LGVTAASQLSGGVISWYHDPNDDLVANIYLELTYEYQPFVGTGSGPDGYPAVGDVIEVKGLRRGSGADVVSYGGPQLCTSFECHERIKINVQHSSQDYAFVGEWSFTGVAVVPVRFPSANNNGEPWLVRFSGCCKSHFLQNNGGKEWDLTTLVDLDQHAAPLPVVFPFLGVAPNDESQNFPRSASGVGTFYIGAETFTDYDHPDNGNAPGYSFSLDENMEQPSGMTIDPDTGKVFYPTNDKTIGMYNNAVVHVGQGYTYSTVDFSISNELFAVGDSENGISPSSVPVISKPSNSYTKMVAYVGYPFATEVAFDDAQTNYNVEDRSSFKVHLYSPTIDISLSEFVFTEGQGVSSSIFTVPTEMDIGRHIVSVLVEDSDGSWSTPHSIGINVQVERPPVYTTDRATGAVKLAHTTYMGSTLKFIAEFCDPNVQDDTVVSLEDHDESLPHNVVLGNQDTSEGVACMSRLVSWECSPTQGGWNQPFCFIARDTFDHTTVQCVDVHCVRCKYALKNHETLREVAHLFDTNWLQLYSLNPSISHPDFDLTPGGLINVGHIYRVALGDDVRRVASKLGMTMNKLSNMNWDLEMPESHEEAMSHFIEVGAPLCVLPDSCGYPPRDRPYQQGAGIGDKTTLQAEYRRRPGGPIGSTAQG